MECGSREYRMNRILGVTADPEAGLVELTLSNRKNPVLITVQEPLLFAARVEKVLQESSEEVESLFSITPQFQPVCFWLCLHRLHC